MSRDTLIWIVDDSPTQAAVTQRAFGTEHRFERFLDGESAIERLIAGALPDLILLDWVMPGISGDEVCRFLRATPRTADVPIIILTASRTEGEDVACALESGANDYVSKPATPVVLRARVNAVLRSAQLKHVADLERRRIMAINHLGRSLFMAGSDVGVIMRELAGALAGKLCDGCAVVLVPGPVATDAIVRHRDGESAPLLALFAGVSDPVVKSFEDAAEALANMPASAEAYIQQCGLRGVATLSLPVRGLVHGTVTVTRDGTELPFDAGDLAAIQICLDLTGLAIEAAIRSDFERATTRFHEEMIGIVSHDLRTPLGAMAMGIEMLGDEAELPARGLLLGRLDRSTKRMTVIVEQLLDVTRTRLGSGIPVSLKPGGLMTIVSDVLAELRLTYRGTSFEQIGDNIEGSWDRDRLGQVVSNLASNAAQYGPPRGVVTVETLRVDDHAIIVVRNENNSAPIPEAQLATMFDPFKRGDASANAKGLGLGLYIVNEIVRAHGGTVAATSDVVATVFRVQLPIAQGAASAA